MSRRLPQLTKLRAARLSRGLRLEDVANEARISRTRASYIERDPSIASKSEIDRLLTAIERLEAAPIGGPTARRLAVDVLGRLGVLLSDVLASGEVTIEELAEMTGIDPAAVMETIEHAVMTRKSSGRYEV